MTDTATLKELLERVERAEGPDRELDAAIDAALFGGFPSQSCHDATRRSYGAGYIHNADDGTNLTQGGRQSELVTASLDSAVSLVERVLPDRWWQITRHGFAPENGEGIYTVRIFWPEGEMTALGPTAPLALCRALCKTLLRALIAQQGTQESDNTGGYEH